MEIPLLSSDFAGSPMNLESFLEPFDLSVLKNKDAKVKYGVYKCSTAKDQLNDYFDKHKNDQWLKEKYHPDFMNLSNEEFKRRLEAFLDIFDEDFNNEILFDLKNKEKIIKLSTRFNQIIDGDKTVKSYLYFPHISFEISKKDFEKILAENDSFVKLAVSDPIVVKSMQPNTKSVIRRPAWASFSSENIDLSVFVKFAESFDMMRMEIDASSTLSEVKPKESDEESDKEKEKPENKPVKDKELYQKAFSNVKEYPVGQVAVKITPVDIFSKQTIESTRRCIVIAAQMIFWLDTLRDLYNTEDKIENLKKILPIMNQIEVPDTNPIEKMVLFSSWNQKYIDPKEDLPKTILMLSKLIDQKETSNPILNNLIDYLVIEENKESTGIETEQLLDQLKKALDRLLAYLRFVHSIDFYAPAMYNLENSMPLPIGLIHVRSQTGNKPIKDYPKSFTRFSSQILSILRLNTPVFYPPLDKIEFRDVLEGHINEDLGVKQLNALLKADCVLNSIGLRDPEDAVEQFVKENTKRKKRKVDVIWLCPLSGKKFREPVFVRKHIMNKFMTQVLEVKKDNAMFFNNYLLDPARPQLIERNKKMRKLNKIKAKQRPQMSRRAPNRMWMNNDRRGRRRGGYRDLDAPN